MGKLLRSSLSRLIATALGVLMVVSCQNNKAVEHRGQNLTDRNKYTVSIDSISLLINGIIDHGDFFMVDSVITFVDSHTATFYEISHRGKLLNIHFQRAPARNEFPALLYAYPMGNDDQKRCVAIDHRNNISLYNPINRTKREYGAMDFGSNDNEKAGGCSKPAIYNIRQISDFAPLCYFIKDSLSLFPVNIVNRSAKSPDQIASNNRSRDRRIFGALDLETMNAQQVIGRFPELFVEKPMPPMQFFQYLMVQDTIFVNHANDPLIYVYKYPQELLYTFGQECAGINRAEPQTTNLDQGQTLGADFQPLGVNSGLLYIHQTKLVCRTYIKSCSNPASGLQLYRNNDLLADLAVPQFFKMLGFYDGYYYGCSFVPAQQERQTKLLLYRLKIDEVSV